MEDLCQREGRGFLAFDYLGHGLSSGKFEEGTISKWLSDSIEIVNSLAKQPIILVGSSMGVWIAHLMALRNSSNIKSLVGIAPAPDFTDGLLWDKFTHKQKIQIEQQGWTQMPTKYDQKGWWPITKELIEDGRQYKILDKPINLTIPVRLIHGMKDEDVPV